jgi:hypothetical protein
MVSDNVLTPGEGPESRSQGFVHRWPVADDYAIHDGVVLSLMQGAPTPVTAYPFSGASSYLPLTRPELPAEFAKVAAGDDASVLAFVRRYGLLSAYDLIPSTAGDPVAWIVAHARAVKLVSDLAWALDRPPDLARMVEGLTVREATGQESVIVLCPQRRETRPRVLIVPPDDPRTMALGIIAHLMNPNLAGVSRQLRVEQSQLVSGFVPQRLLDFLYWLLADAIVDAKLRPCRACGRFFIATHRRMQFCPRPMGQWGVSACMNRAKQARFKEAKAQRRTRPARPATARRGTRPRRTE